MKKNAGGYLVWLLLLSICGCQTSPESQLNEQLNTAVLRHENLLRQHFLGQTTGYDVATLLNITTDIADQLRNFGYLKDARRFDSYRDVLMYGQYTIDESIDDVQKLVDHGLQSRLY